ncbi:RDD family protein [Actinoplanes sp. M2I2]|uniref:RDD family protein n=1 Tax=Actinoplanes sp. M2I2 TaxID=1734444 RepID=UPI002022489C|nr:RDD family protein [Actinoplanes sp. M2I2]
MTQPPGYGPPPGYPAAPAYLPPPPPPVPVSPAGVPLADFAQRLLAYMIDGALLSAVGFAVALPVFVVVFLRLPDVDPYATEPFGDLDGFFLPLLLAEAGLFLLLLLIYYLYVVEFMHRTGQTLGKKAMKIRVVPLDPGRTLTRGMAARRYLVEYVGGLLVPFFSFVDGLWQLRDKPYQQTLHDKVARTVVVKVSP